MLGLKLNHVSKSGHRREKLIHCGLVHIQQNFRALLIFTGDVANIKQCYTQEY